ncbi:MAG: helix-turn-helix domain-containing protein [Candidatus Poseidoniia archaeon]
MDRPPMILSSSDLENIEQAIIDVQNNGRDIRKIFASYYTDEVNINWEVDAAVDAFEMFSSRWTIEILAALYIAGNRRFNELRTLLRGISSRTLSDKLTTCQQHGLVLRSVEEGPPIRVTYQLTTHGRMCGRLLSPLVAYMKLHKELVKSDS